MAYQSEALVTQLKEARQGSGISQRALSARAGLTQSHISQIERGTMEPGLSTLIDLARALDLELALIPKKMMPAVQTIVKGATPHKELSLEAANAGLKEVVRGEKLISKQRKLYGGSADLDKIADTFRFMRQSPLTSKDIALLHEQINILAAHLPSGTLAIVTKDVAGKLGHLRNRLAHGVSDAPRPAYALDSEDDDA